jgi:hypothetical protein
MPAQHAKSGERKMGEKIVEAVIVGRNKTPVPPEEVYKLAQIGCKDKEIAEWFDIRPDTLRYNFARELLRGRETMRQSLRRSMWEAALQDRNITMMIYLSKNFLGMSDNGMSSEATEPLPWNDDI